MLKGGRGTRVQLLFLWNSSRRVSLVFEGLSIFLLVIFFNESVCGWLGAVCVSTWLFILVKEYLVFLGSE